MVGRNGRKEVKDVGASTTVESFSIYFFSRRPLCSDLITGRILLIISVMVMPSNSGMIKKRRRTQLAEISDVCAKRVTLSKRKDGLFRKATELGALCGARVGIITFSLGGKPFLFGEDVIEDYLETKARRSALDEIADWVESGVDACETAEELESLIAQYGLIQQAVASRMDSLLVSGSSASSEAIFNQTMNSASMSSVSYCCCGSNTPGHCQTTSPPNPDPSEEEYEHELGLTIAGIDSWLEMDDDDLVPNLNPNTIQPAAAARLQALEDFLLADEE